MRLRTAGFVFGLAPMLLGAQPVPAVRSASGIPPAFLLGEFDDDYSGHFSVSPNAFRQGAKTVYDVVEWNVAGQYLIAQNAATNARDAGTWTRIDWMPLSDMPPYAWAFCLSAYKAATREAAIATRVANRAMPRTGCNGFPFSRMKRAEAASVATTDNRIDVVTPMAPELAAYGKYAIGARTITVTEKNRPDVLRTKQGQPTARYDRSLVLEVWYPAAAAANAPRGGEYRAIIRDPTVTVTLRGQARRDAAPLQSEGAFPLVIISHGYPGNRFLLSHLGENLASKGYVVVSIDHTESTYDNAQAFASTLYNRSLDQLFVLRELDRLGAASSGSFLSGRVDASRTGIIGYSMGGYGAVNVIGGGYRAAAASFPGAPPNQLLLERSAGNPAYLASMDARIKAAVAIGPWGMPAGFWDAAGLSGIRTPTLFVAGSVDEVSGYETGTRAIYRAAVNADRYLLTFLNAGHNAGAPYPAPAESYVFSEALKSYPFIHYADPVWDTRRMNNILAHFVTAHLDARVKGDTTRLAYFALVPNGKDGVFAMDVRGAPQATHTYWKGFKRATAMGLMLDQEHAAPPP